MKKARLNTRVCRKANILASVIWVTNLRCVIGMSVFVAIAPVMVQASAQAAQLINWQFNPATQRLEVNVPGGTSPRYFLLGQPARIVLDLPNTSVGNVPEQRTYSGLVRQIRVGQFEPGLTRIVIELSPDAVLAPQQVELEQLSADNPAGDRWALRPVFANAQQPPSPPIEADTSGVDDAPVESLSEPPPTATSLPLVLPDNSEDSETAMGEVSNDGLSNDDSSANDASTDDSSTDELSDLDVVSEPPFVSDNIPSVSDELPRDTQADSLNEDAEPLETSPEETRQSRSISTASDLEDLAAELNSSTNLVIAPLPPLEPGATEIPIDETPIIPGSPDLEQSTSANNEAIDSAQRTDNESREPDDTSLLMPVAPVAEDEVTQSEIPEDETIEDGITESEIAESEIAESEIPEDEIPEDEIPEDEIPEDETIEDGITESEIPESEIAGSEIPESEISEDRITESEIPENEITEDEIAEDEIIEDGESSTTILPEPFPPEGDRAESNLAEDLIENEPSEGDSSNDNLLELPRIENDSVETIADEAADIDVQERVEDIQETADSDVSEPEAIAPPSTIEPSDLPPASADTEQPVTVSVPAPEGTSVIPNSEAIATIRDRVIPDESSDRSESTPLVANQLSIARNLITIIDFGEPLLSSRVWSDPPDSQSSRADGDGMVVAANSDVLLPSGTQLPLRYPRTSAQVLVSDPPRQEVLLVNQTIRDSAGRVVVPEGSQVLGRFEAAPDGFRFVTQAIRLNNRNVPLIAQSESLSSRLGDAAIALQPNQIVEIRLIEPVSR